MNRRNFLKRFGALFAVGSLAGCMKGEILESHIDKTECGFQPDALFVCDSDNVGFAAEAASREVLIEGSQLPASKEASLSLALSRMRREVVRLL